MENKNKCFRVFALLIVLLGLKTISYSFSESKPSEEAKIHFKKAKEYKKTASVVHQSDTAKYLLKAVHEYKKVLFIEPKYMDAHFLLGVCYNELIHSTHEDKYFLKNIDVLKNIIELLAEPRLIIEGPGYFVKGRAGYCEEVATMYRWYYNELPANEKNPEILSNAKKYEQLAKKYRDELPKQESMKKYYRRAKKTFTDNEQGLLKAAQSYIAQNKSAEAAGLLDKFAKKYPESKRIESALLSLMWCNKTTKSPKEYKEYLEERIIWFEEKRKKNFYSPGFLTAFDRHCAELAVLYAKENKYKKAIDALETMTKYFINDSGYIWHDSNEMLKVLDCYKKTGQWSKAIDFLKNSLCMTHPNFRGIYLNYIGALYKEFPKKKEGYPNVQREIKKYKKSIRNKRWLLNIKYKDLGLSAIKSGKPNQNFLVKNMKIGKDCWRGEPEPNINRLLIAFDIKQLSPYKITLARLYIFTRLNGICSTHRITREWNPKEVTWERSRNNKGWKNPGGDYNAVAESVNSQRDYFNPEISMAKGVIQSFDITSYVKDIAEQSVKNHGILIKEYDEHNRFPRNNRSIPCDKISLAIIIESEEMPDIEGIMEYQEDWFYFYLEGVDAFKNNELGKTIAYWVKALEMSVDKGIKCIIKEHISTVNSMLKKS